MYHIHHSLYLVGHYLFLQFYLKLKNLSLLGTSNIKGGSISPSSLKIIDINNNKEINIKIDNILISSESEEFIEIFSN